MADTRAIQWAIDDGSGTSEKENPLKTALVFFNYG